MKYLLAILAIIILSFFYVWQGIYLPKDASVQESAVFLVKKGESLQDVASDLENKELIKNRYFFIFYALSQKKELELKAGKYKISPSINIPEILNKIVSGDRVKKIITIIEGWTVEDIEERLGMGKIDSELEGYLFPDTYELSPEDNLEDIIKRIRANFEKKTASLDVDEDAIIMASLIEKEVQTMEDKKLVSGILRKRLEIGMPLQVDAAMITYKIKGLPDKPICNPGLESIEAALNPKESDYLYYISVPSGKTIFSRTSAEHKAAIEKYLK